MKYRIAVALLFASFMNVSAFADVPPQPGTVQASEITGQAAHTLAAFIGGAATQFPAAIGSISIELPGQAPQIATQGQVAVNQTSHVTIGCARVYFRGHHAKCKLIRAY